jgi:hypothetical protein
MMRGWKTWVAVAGLALLAAVDLSNGDTEAALEKAAGALALVGIGHKVEKAVKRGVN